MSMPPGSRLHRLTATVSQGRGAKQRPDLCGIGLGGMLVLLTVALTTVGCGRTGPPPRKRVPVSGTVTLDGKLLPDGFVSFVSPAEGYLESFPIKDGKFAGKTGLGSRTVEIIALRDTQPPPAGGGAQAPPTATRTNYLPPKYSTASALKADVTEGGPNVFAFDLTMGK